MIVCAACKCGNIVVLGKRHYDPMMRTQMELLDERGIKFSGANVVQGFVDDQGNFLTRMEAWFVAEKNNQIFRRVGADGPDGEGLFSENLY